MGKEAALTAIRESIVQFTRQAIVAWLTDRVRNFVRYARLIYRLGGSAFEVIGCFLTCVGSFFGVLSSLQYRMIVPAHLQHLACILSRRHRVCSLRLLEGSRFGPLRAPQNTAIGKSTCLCDTEWA